MVFTTPRGYAVAHLLCSRLECLLWAPVATVHYWSILLVQVSPELVFITVSISNVPRYAFNVVICNFNIDNLPKLSSLVIWARLIKPATYWPGFKRAFNLNTPPYCDSQNFVFEEGAFAPKPNSKVGSQFHVVENPVKVYHIL